MSATLTFQRRCHLDLNRLHVYPRFVHEGRQVEQAAIKFGMVHCAQICPPPNVTRLISKPLACLTSCSSPPWCMHLLS